VLRPGKRPTGRENAVIVGRVLRLMRQAWPYTHIILRGDGHFANPELMVLRSTATTQQLTHNTLSPTEMI
jgi:hypothetical protein